MVYRLPIITFDSSETPLRSCRPCYYSKTRCNREVPHCQTCLKRGKPSLCVYETKMPDQNVLFQSHNQSGKIKSRKVNMRIITFHGRLLSCNPNSICIMNQVQVRRCNTPLSL
ncbi:unnamed protein product [Penicillium nalgiovense]|nr:unnamed protein product [Penicillium nalgiovense]